MSCCGQARGRATIRNKSTDTAGVPGPSTVIFEYVGRTALSIIGPATRTSYRFGKPGARAIVDARDRNSLAAVPVLRQVLL